MKKLLITILGVLLSFCSLLFVACGGDDSTPTPETPTPDNPALENFTGISFNDKTVTFDGTEHSIVIEGQLPEGTNVNYTNNKGTNAGTYSATAVLSKEGYNNKTLNAKLTINKATMTGITLPSDTVDYDSSLHSLNIVGTTPAGASVKYTYNSKNVNGVSNAGVYNVQATVSAPNYHDFIIEGKLTINKATMTGITLPSDSVEYDTFLHSLNIMGTPPVGFSVEYTYNGEKVNGVSAPGVYNVQATVSAPNYHDFIVDGKLTITTTEEPLYSARIGNKIYFQNNLDENKLYAYENGSIKKINNDVPNHMLSNGENLYYISQSLLSGVLKSYNGEEAVSLTWSVACEYLATDGSFLYYAVNNPIPGMEHGIYKLDLNGTLSDPIKIGADKAEYLTYYGNYIYYSNKSNDGKLCRISTSANNATGAVLWEEKVDYIIEDNGVLYFNSTKTLVGGIGGYSAAIYKYNLSSQEAVKLTSDRGAYLTKVGNHIYYVNKDLLTTSLFGKGIVRVSIAGGVGNVFTREEVLSCDTPDGFSSLTSDGYGNIYYYRLIDKHFYSYNVSTATSTDLMEGFVPPNNQNLYNYADTTLYNNEIYYISPLDNNLYRFNPTTNHKVKLLADNVSGVWFNDGYMYYGTYILVNYALWRLDLQTNETTKISSDRCDNLIFDGDKIYFVKVGSLYNNHLHSMNLDGTNVTLLNDNDNLWVKSLAKVGNTFYYTRNPKIFAENLSSYTIGDSKPVDLKIKARIVLVHNNKLYYYNHDDKVLGSCNLDGTNANSIVTNVEINEMIIHNNTLYFSSISSENNGLFKVNLSNNTKTKISSHHAEGLIVVNNNLYFINTAIYYRTDYPFHEMSGEAFIGDGKLYKYDGTSVTMVA